MADDELIDEQYQVINTIYSGSSTTVLEVIEKSSSRNLAMKLLKSDIPEFKANRSKMKVEAQIHKAVEHPLIPKFEKFSSSRDHTYIIMEYFRASNLKVQIKADTNGVHLKIRQLFEGICTVLAHVHSKGFIHRDIKPDNILMNRVGEIRLCDFSLSSVQKKGLVKFFAGRLRTIQGTRTYIAPETIRRQQPTIQTDMYSLGVLFFEVLACKTPFQAPTPEELLKKHLTAEAPNPSEFYPNVSPEMDRIIARLLKKKAADRPASVDEILAEIKRIRIFKEDIVDEMAAKKASADDDALAMLSEIRLDSRLDAKLKEMLETNPEFAKRFAAEKANKATKKKAESDKNNAQIKKAEAVEAARVKPGQKPAASAKPAVQAAPQAVPQQMPMQMPMPGYPMGYQQYPAGYPGYPQGQMPMMPGMAQPMQGAVQYPGQPPLAYPQQGQPQPAQPQPMQRPPAAPVPPQAAVKRPTPAPPAQTTRPAQPQQRPPQAVPAKPTTATQPRPAQKPSQAPPTPPADLDFMTDLPDIS